jgi:hypothetical protein
MLALALAAWACGGDDDSGGDGNGAETPVPETPAEEYVIAGVCPAEPEPTGEPGAVVDGLLVVGFSQDTTIDEAQAFLDEYVTDYRIGLFQFDSSRIAIICVEPGSEDEVTRLLPLGGDLRFVQRYRIGGF